MDSVGQLMGVLWLGSAAVWFGVLILFPINFDLKPVVELRSIEMVKIMVEYVQNVTFFFLNKPLLKADPVFQNELTDDFIITVHLKTVLLYRRTLMAH